MNGRCIAIWLFSNPRSNYIGFDVSRIKYEQSNWCTLFSPRKCRTKQQYSAEFPNLFFNNVHPTPKSTCSSLLIILLLPTLSGMSQFRFNFRYVGYSVRAKMGLLQGLYLQIETQMRTPNAWAVEHSVRLRPGATAHAHLLSTCKQIAETP
jgi:hypothetical protein